MNNVNKTLYIPLYGKALVSAKGIILKDKKAEDIWAQEGFALKGKSKSKWLAYYMSMRAASFDSLVRSRLESAPEAVVLHIGCGMDSRAERIGSKAKWYDIDFPEVIEQRKRYYCESESYKMLAADVREDNWLEKIGEAERAIIILEGVTMYFEPAELKALLSSVCARFASVCVLLDCYTTFAAKASKYRNPINDVGVTQVTGYDSPEEISQGTALRFVKEHSMTPQKLIDELEGFEKKLFSKLYAGKTAGNMYRMYEFEK